MFYGSPYRAIETKESGSRRCQIRISDTSGNRPGKYNQLERRGRGTAPLAPAPAACTRLNVASVGRMLPARHSSAALVLARACLHICAARDWSLVPGAYRRGYRKVARTLLRQRGSAGRGLDCSSAAAARTPRECARFLAPDASRSFPIGARPRSSASSDTGALCVDSPVVDGYLTSPRGPGHPSSSRR